MPERILVQGVCDQKFARIYEAMEENLNDSEPYIGSEHYEYGAHVAAYLDGKLVVNLWGGHRDQARKVPWTADTLVNVFSCGKPMAVFSLLKLAEQGKLDLDAPVAKYWPAFGQNGKEDIKVWMTLCMQTGITVLDVKAGDAFDYCKMMRAVEEAPAANGVGTPTWSWIYHSFFGPPLVRLITGRTMGQFWEEEISDAFDIDFHFGLSTVDQKRFAPNIFGTNSPFLQAVRNPDPNNPWFASGTALPMEEEYVNCERYLASEIGAANGCATAELIARYYSALATGGTIDGKRLISKDMIKYSREIAWATESYLGLPFTLTRGCYEMNGDAFVDYGKNKNNFGSKGLCDSTGFADTDAGLGFCWQHNMATPGSDNSKYYQRIIDALNDVLY